MRHTLVYKFLIFSLVLLSGAMVLPKDVHADDCAQITEKPTLYQVTQTGANAALYFTPVNSQTTGYTINYGLSQGDDRYNVDFLYGNSSGAITYTVGGLDTSLHYFFRVRAKNACSTGPYSDWLAANVTSGTTSIQGGAADATGSGTFTTTPPPAVPTTATVSVPVTGVSSMLLMSLAALGLCVLGGGLFLGGKKGFSL